MAAGGKSWYSRSIIFSHILTKSLLNLKYCEYHPNYEAAKKWMEDNLSDDVKSLYVGDGELKPIFADVIIRNSFEICV